MSVANLRHILIVDDQETPGVRVLDGNVTVTTVANSEDALRALGGQPVDLLILDWILSIDDKPAAFILTELMDMPRFIPVVVWTQQPTMFEAECPDQFPRVCLDVMEKCPLEELLTKVQDLFNRSFAVRLAGPWRLAVHKTLEELLYHLARANPKDQHDFLYAEANDDRGVNAIHQLLSHALIEDERVQAAIATSVEEGRSVDTDAVFSSLQGILANQVSTEAFARQVAEALKMLIRLKDKPGAGGSQGTTTFNDLVHAEMYYRLPETDRWVRTGDVISLTVGTESLKGLVLTPACDMKKTRFLRIALLEKESTSVEPNRRNGIRRGDNYARACLFVLDGEEHFVVNFHDLLVLHVPPVEDQPGQHLWHELPKDFRLTYDQTYRTRTGQEVTITRDLRLDDPYRSDILQRFAAHSARIGIPELRYRAQQG